MMKISSRRRYWFIFRFYIWYFRFNIINCVNALQNPMLTNLVEKKSPPLIGVSPSGPIRSDSNEENPDEPSSKKPRTDVRFRWIFTKFIFKLFNWIVSGECLVDGSQFICCTCCFNSGRRRRTGKLIYINILNNLLFSFNHILFFSWHRLLKHRQQMQHHQHNQPLKQNYSNKFWNSKPRSRLYLKYKNRKFHAKSSYPLSKAKMVNWFYMVKICLAQMIFNDQLTLLTIWLFIRKSYENGCT